MLEFIKVSYGFLSSVLIDNGASRGVLGAELDKCGPLKTLPDPDLRCEPAKCMVVPCIPNDTVCDPQIEICIPHVGSI